MDRREFLKRLFATGAVTAAGLYLPEEFLRSTTYISIPKAMPATVYSNSSSMLAQLKELYSDDHFFKGLIFNKNPFLEMVKEEPASNGLYLPMPLKLVSS